MVKTKRDTIFLRYGLLSFTSLYVYELFFWFFSGYGGEGSGYEDAINAEVGRGIHMSADPLFLLLYVSIFSAFYISKKTSWELLIPKPAKYLFQFLIFINLIALVRGIFSASGYLDYKLLFVLPSGGTALLVPLNFVIGTQKKLVQKILFFLIKYLRYFVFIIPLQILMLLASSESFAHLTVPVLLLLCALPFIPKKEKWIFLALALISFFLTLGWRANELRIIFLLLVFISFSLFKKINNRLLYLINLLLFIAPLVFLSLGISGNTNIFQRESTTEGIRISQAGQQVNIVQDTRSFLYSEVLNDMVITKTLYLGKGANARYKTQFYLNDIPGGERATVEVGFLKNLMDTGILGVLVFGFILFIAMRYTTLQSNNNFSKMLGLFISFSWLLFFIENMQRYDLFNYMLWLVVGMALSSEFRKMTNADIQILLNKQKYRWKKVNALN